MGALNLKKVVAIIFLTIFICGCESRGNVVNYQYSSNPKIESLMINNDFILLDVRTKEEYDKSHLKGAINIPYDEINEDTILDKNLLIFVYCKSGNRSSIAFENLTNLGYNVYDLGAFDKLDLPKE